MKLSNFHLHRCIATSGERAIVDITILDACGRGYTKCEDGMCILASQLCDGVAQCRDKSDEDPRFCKGDLITVERSKVKQKYEHIFPLIGLELSIIPREIVSYPWNPFKFTCIASHGERPSILFVRNLKPIELDPRFSVRRPQENIVEVTAPQGLAFLDKNEQLVFVFFGFISQCLLLKYFFLFLFVYRCITITGEQKVIPISITNPCGVGRLLCKDGTCIPSDDFCNGRNDCLDGSDESPFACPG